MKDKKKKNIASYAMGTGKNGLVRHYIESPDETLVENDIMLARAKEKAMNNGWGQALDIFGNMAVQYGTSMMNSGGGGSVPAGGQAGFGGNIVAGGGDGGAFGQGFGDFMGDNSQMLASGISMLPMLANMFGPGFAMGGQVQDNVPVEVEGEEVGETPDGKLLDFKGPSHENGGIGVNLPAGTEIFSKRIKVGGKTMAERKKAREKKELTLERLLDGNKTDKATKNSLDRTKRNNEIEEKKDQEIQQFVGAMQSMANFAFGTGPEGIPMFNNGGKVPPYVRKGFNYSFLQDIMRQGDLEGYNFDTLEGRKAFQKSLGVAEDGLFGKDTMAAFDTNYDLRPIETKMAGIQPIETSIETPSTLPLLKTNDFNPVTTKGEDATKKKEGAGFEMPGFTGGDLVSMAGNIYSAFAPMKNTQKNRAGDTPNINAYEDFGNDALDVLDESKGYVGQQRDNALKDLEVSRTGATKRNRNGARGINQIRALDIASQAQANQGQANIYDVFAKQMMSILGQEANMENVQDQMVMQGEQARDLADRQDRDNYYTQLAQDIATKGQGIQQIGKDLNQVTQNKEIEDLIAQLSKHGYDITKKG